MNITISPYKTINSIQLTEELKGITDGVSPCSNVLIIHNVTNEALARAIYDSHIPVFDKKDEEIFLLPISAPTVTAENFMIASEYIVQSPKPQDTPSKALSKAIELTKTKDKPLAEILLNLVSYIEDMEKRITELEKKK